MSFYKKNSFTRIFVVIAFFIALSALLFSAFLMSKIVRIHNDVITLRLENQASLIERTFTNSIDSAAYLITLVSQQIRQNGADPKYLKILLPSFQSQTEDENTKKILSFSMFSWVNSDFKLLVSSKLGILPRPIDLFEDQYWHMVKANSGTIQLGFPIGGYISGQWVIPIAIGVTDVQGHYLGGVALGLDIYYLLKKLESVRTLEGISFAVIDKRNLEVIARSSNHHLNSKEISSLFEKVELSENTSKHLTHSYYFKKNTFDSYYQLSKYPYIIHVIYDKKLSNAEWYHAISFVLGEFLFITFAAVLFLYGIRKILVNPIVSLSDAVDQISCGKEEVFIPNSNIYEIRNLSKNIRKVQQLILSEQQAQKALQEAHFELKELNEHLEEKVSERTTELEKALKIKTDFLNNLNHEIRSPIHGVMTSANGLLCGWAQLTNEERYKWVQYILQFSNRLNNFVNNILDMSRMEAGKMNYQFSKNDILVLIKDVLKEYGPYAMEQKKVKLYIRHTHKEFILNCDILRIEQVMRNLIGNAVKFTKPQTTILLLLTYCQLVLKSGEIIKGVQLQIIDEGIGIPEDEVEEIFKPFTQSSCTNTGAGGTGLGLAIAKEIVTAHHGLIYARNYEKGAIFTIALPCDAQAIEEDAIVTVETDVHQTIPYEEQAPESIVLLESTPIKTTTENKSLRIAMIDDEVLFLHSMELMFSRTNYTFTPIEGGETGLEYIQQNAQEIDVIMLDMMMPDKDGITILKELKADPRLMHLPVIMQSGAAEVELEKTLTLGAIGFLRKPYHIEQLNEILEKIKNASYDKKQIAVL